MEQKEYLFENTSAEINNAPVKAAPVDADKFGIWDSVTGLLKSVTWAAIKAAVDVLFPSNVIYVAKNGNDLNNGTLGAPLLTIQAGINLAVAGQTVDVAPGTYVENLTLKAGVSLIGSVSRSTFVTGTVTADFVGTVYVHSIDFQSATGVVLNFAGVGAMNLQLDDCHLDSQSGGSHCINYTNTNAASRLTADNGAMNVAVSTGGARVFTSPATAKGTVIWEDISARVNDNLDNIALNIDGTIAFTHTGDDVHGQVVVSTLSTYVGTNSTMQTTSVPVLVTNSAGVSVLAQIVCTTTANPAVTGAGGFAYGLIGYSSTGRGFAGTLNGGAGAAPFPTSAVQLATESATASAYNGKLRYDGTHLWLTTGGSEVQLDQQASISNTITRQTVLSGPQVLSGAAWVPNFLAATYAGLVVTTQNVSTGVNQLIATASNGDSDVKGRSTTNLTWPACTANQTNYLFCNVSGGALIPVAPTILPPIEQDGGTPSTVLGQYTYNIKEHTMYLGNGTSAVIVNHVKFGEVVAGAATITSTIAYAYEGRYSSGYTNGLPAAGSNTSKNHNIGTDLVKSFIIIECLISEGGIPIGYDSNMPLGIVAGGSASPIIPLHTTTTVMFGVPTGGWALLNLLTWLYFTLTNANWKWKIVTQREWN